MNIKEKYKVADILGRHIAEQLNVVYLGNYRGILHFRNSDGRLFAARSKSEAEMIQGVLNDR